MKRFFYYFIKNLIRVFVKIIFPYEIINKEKLKTLNNYIICSNHISLLDPAFIVFAVNHKKIYFMAKEELFKNKIFGAFIKFYGAFPVKRGNGHEAIKTGCEIMSRGDIMCIFPEGTRSKNGSLGKIKSGIMVIASQFKSDIVPVAIVTKNQHIKAFRKTKIIIGDKIDYSELNVSENSTKELRAASEKLFIPISDMIVKYGNNNNSRE